MQDLALIKVESALQANSVAAFAGKSVTVTSVSATTNLATLTPVDGGSAVTVKLDAARQVGELKALLGKTVVVGKAPLAAGGIGNWIGLYPAAAGAQTAASAGQLVMLKVEGGLAAAQLPGLTGQTVTVVQPQVAVGTKAAKLVYLKTAGANGSLIGLPVQNALQAKGLVGQSFLVMKSPVVGGTVGKYLVLTPVSAAAAKVTAGTAMAAKFTPAAVTKTAAVGGGTVAAAATAGGSSALTTGAALTSPVAAASSGSGILGAKGVSLGLGIGAGAWGPVLLGVAGLVGAVSLYAYYKQRRYASDLTDDELQAELAVKA